MSVASLSTTGSQVGSCIGESRKMGSPGGKGSNVDLSHHINRKSKARHPSPLKDIIQYMGYDGMISLAGGLPHPSLFHLRNANFDCLAPSAPISSSDSHADKAADDLLSLTLGRGPSPGDLELTRFLQYGSGAGDRQLVKQCRDLTERVHAPPCEYEIILTTGNTSAWAKVVGLLCEDDDYILVEEYTYPSAQALWIPLGVRAVPVNADADGIQADRLREILADWDEETRGARRPRVIYLVSVGSNPTGISISAARRKEIYDVCVEYDIIIVEDDPYYCLQYPGYQTSSTTQDFEPQKTEDFLKSLTPSFLSMDTQGRVIRLDSFSKTIFPGLRLGYYIASPVFIERLLRATEVDTQDPAGLSQAFALALLQRWGIDGYLTWVQNLKYQYQTRRDWLLDAFHENFAILPASESPVPKAQGLVACIEDGQGQLRPVFSFVDPGAGMFVWSEFYFENVSRFLEIEASTECEDPEQRFAAELWKAWADQLVLLTPGSYYHPWEGPDKTTTKARGAEPRVAHFRFSFATPSKEQIAQGVERVRHVVGEYWK
ncbi:pyridoxal phosphate-dependent transferase [Xylariomycetidae sp. FL2044]|nr:pyridoxal phosphate-dependent transferase [Xylariomycetidae sp. FL2044]